MNIDGAKVRIRPIEPGDLPMILKWNNDSEVEEFLDGESPRTIEKCREWFSKNSSNRHAKAYVFCAQDGTLLGDIELINISWRSGDGEMRIRIGEKDHWNRGYGTDAVTTLLRHAFVDLGLSRVYLRVYSHNMRAIRVYTKCGFRKEGLLRHRQKREGWSDIILMRILRSEFLKTDQRSA